jgi:predicted acetyltransferase
MNISIHPAGKDEKEILRNLLEKYLYEFSQYENTDVSEFGLYGYDYLDHYWVEKNRFPFFIKVDGKLAGFIMVNDYPEVNIKTNYTLSEIFVMYKYRNMGVGAFAAKYVFDKFKGKWQLKRHPKNVGSVRFWDMVISEYTGGKYELLKSHPLAEYVDGTAGDVFIFET